MCDFRNSNSSWNSKDAIEIRGVLHRTCYTCDKSIGLRIENAIILVVSENELPRVKKWHVILKRCKGHTHKGHREKVLKVMNFRYVQGVFRELWGVSGYFQGVFPFALSGMPFGSFE